MKSLYAYFSWYWLCNEDWVKCYCKDSFEKLLWHMYWVHKFHATMNMSIIIKWFLKKCICDLYHERYKKKSHTKAKYTLNLEIFSTWYHTSTHIHVYICNELNFCLQWFYYNIFGYMYVVLCLQHKSESAYHTILCINTILKCIP